MENNKILRPSSNGNEMDNFLNNKKYDFLSKLNSIDTAIENLNRQHKDIEPQLGVVQSLALTFQTLETRMKMESEAYNKLQEDYNATVEACNLMAQDLKHI
jgi:hypothetical protein